MVRTYHLRQRCLQDTTTTMSVTINKNFYNTILCQTFSPCGNLLVVGDIYGCIHVFQLNKILHPETNLTKEELLPVFQLTVKEGYQVNSLVATNVHLIVGTVGEICGYTWRNVKLKKNVKHWAIELPETKGSYDINDVNCMLHDVENNQLFIGCGNNLVHIYDIETRSLVKSLSGHKDYIHGISFMNGDLVSAGEDGQVKIWDVKSGKAAHTLVPGDDARVDRPSLGKWVGAVSATRDYILCGGGPRLALYHSRFLSISTVYPIDDTGIHVAQIVDDRIMAGGRCPLFYQMDFIGNVVSEIATAAMTTYTAAFQTEGPCKVLSLAGASPKIDICSNNFLYKNQQLSLY